MDGEGKKLSGQESHKHVETCHDSLGEELSRGNTTDHFGSCTICGLEAVQRAFCHFCQEHESHENHGCSEGHKNNIHAAYTQQQSTCSNSQDTQHSARPHFNAGTNDTCSVGISVGREGDRGARLLEHHADESQLGRTPTERPTNQQWGDGGAHQGFEEGIEPPRRLGELPDKGGDSLQPTCHHRPTLCEGRASHHRGLRTPGQGADGLREVRKPHHGGSDGVSSKLHEMGGGHIPGDGSVSLEAEKGSHVCSADSRKEGLPGATSPEHQVQEGNSAHQCGRQRWQFRESVGGQARVFSDSVFPEDQARFHGGRDPDCRAPAEDSAARERESRDGTPGSPQQEPEGDVGGQLKVLSNETAVLFAKRWETCRNPYSDNWSQLYRHGRPILMELACYPNSLLSEEVEQRFGKGSSMRVSNWNGGDLETPEGRQLVKQLIRKHRPLHLWISCECGPYSPLQHINKRTPEQVKNLEEKQYHARLQYAGGIEVAEYAMQYGTEVHWELSARCEAWKLPMVNDFVTKHGLGKVSCNGCCVGLRTVDKTQLLCKAWTIATKNTHLLRHMNLKCQNNHPKGKCESGQTAHTARYTSAFVRRVIDSLVEHEAWSHVVQELSQPDVEETFAAEDAREPQETFAAEDAREPQETFAAEDAREPQDEGEEITEEEKKAIEAKIQHIHRTTGHGSMRNLVEALKRRGSSNKVIQIAKSWTCPTCAERKRQDPRRFSTLQTVAAKWEVVEIDTGVWVHPVTKKKVYFILFVDSGCRFKVGKILFEDSRKTATWNDLKTAFEELWLPIFGKPRGVRVDPAGAWLNTQAESYFSQHDILFDHIPAEAHWQISAVEQGIKTVKGIMESLATDFVDMEIRELFARSLWVCNNQEIYKGYSPLQHALGRAPDEHQRMFECDDVKPILPSVLADGGFQEDATMRCKAEKAFAEEQAKRRLERAARMGHRRAQVYVPGDLVYYWRKQLQPGDRTSFQTGKFLGPARVIATETRKDEEGILRPGSVVWVHRGGRLLRCAPEQLRKASPHEQQIEELHGPVELPWTITTLATDPSRRTYVDISGEVPSEEEWDRAFDQDPERQEPEREIPTVRFRRKASAQPESYRGKFRQPPPIQEKKRSEQDMESGGASSSSRPNKEPRSGDHDSALFVTEESRKAYEINLQLPNSKRGIKKFTQNPEAYMVNQLKRRQVEVREKTLTKEEALQFHAAKQTEVRNFLASQCFKSLGDHIPEESKVLGMRWLLTWKYDPKYEDGKKAKARAVVLGYQDPEYATRQTSAPTPSKAGRQLFLQYCAYRKFRLAKGDVSGAFLQGMDMREELWCRPLPEMCEQLGIEEGTPMLLTKAAYGLVQAPLYWYESVCHTLSQLGYRRLQTESCCWIYQDDTGVVRSMIHAHVDDFVFAGSRDCQVHQRLMEQLKQVYNWGTWEYDSFEQCGILIRQDDRENIFLSQRRFIEELEEIPLNRDRSRQQELPTTDKEKSALRGLLGSLSWLCGQTCFMYSVDVNFLITCIPVSTVGEIVKANALVRNVKKWYLQEFQIHSFHP